MRRLDHIVVACEDLDKGAACLGKTLGRSLDSGGSHPVMGTHNRLLNLGRGSYLELIAIDPTMPAPHRPRWFTLDSFEGAPRLVGWAARDSAFVAPQGTTVTEMKRGDLHWQITLPDGAQMPGEGTHPLLIRWIGGGHPCDTLPDRGFRLKRLDLQTPGPAARSIGDPRIRTRYGPTRLKAMIHTPDGRDVWL
ncbi:VOC family protein [Paracoccus sp. TK19116]|uniref:VOC family protein n=1 Tax=Paracoccus albicereus TaxID=2922394 RepID=A0ABT1MXE9_9RHOB|nr:VOC family protein [Paracoccus albicereus]MCQ0971551.1 VOC family protein [Paracoccus albicereus]